MRIVKPFGFWSEVRRLNGDIVSGGAVSREIRESKYRITWCDRPAAIAPVGTALPHQAGCGQLGPDLRITHDTLAAYCQHPNVGAVLVVALGCEQVIAQYLADVAHRAGKPAEIVAIQSEGGTVRATDRGIGIAGGSERNWIASRGRRATFRR